MKTFIGLAMIVLMLANLAITLRSKNRRLVDTLNIITFGLCVSAWFMISIFLIAGAI